MSYIYDIENSILNIIGLSIKNNYIYDDDNFDFDDIGKRTPYRTPDGFFEDVQQKVMERAGVKQ